jgi:hypothetical protein
MAIEGSIGSTTATSWWAGKMRGGYTGNSAKWIVRLWGLNQAPLTVLGLWNQFTIKIWNFRVEQFEQSILPGTRSVSNHLGFTLRSTLGFAKLIAFIGWRMSVISSNENEYRRPTYRTRFLPPLSVLYGKTLTGSKNSWQELETLVNPLTILCANRKTEHVHAGEIRR